MVYVALEHLKKNSPPAKLTASVESTDVEFSVDHPEYFLNSTGGVITKGIVIDPGNINPLKPEEITITAASTSANTISGLTRGVHADGSIGIASSWDAGTEISVNYSYGIHEQIRDNFAAAVGTWASFAPGPVWSGGMPTITSTVARYVRNGNIITFDITIIVSEGNDAVLDSLDLPVPATQTANRYVPIPSFKSITIDGDSILSDPFGYVDFTEATPVIKFHQFGTIPSGYTAVLNVSGSYGE